jgi:hypothetical protein
VTISRARGLSRSTIHASTGTTTGSMLAITVALAALVRTSPASESW